MLPRPCKRFRTKTFHVEGVFVQNAAVKYSQVIALLPRLLSARDAEDYVCGPTMLADLREHWGLKPLEQRKGLTVYDRHDIDRAIEQKKLRR